MVCQTFLLDPILYAVTLHTWIIMLSCLTAGMFLIVPYCATENLTKQQLQEYLYFSCDITFFSFDRYYAIPWSKVCRYVQNVQEKCSHYA